MREPGSRSRCPAHYSRPRVLVVRSPRARGARSGLLARYVGGHLALGGYADVDVRPWRDDAAPPPEEAAAPPADAPVKDLRAVLARRGAPTPRGAAEKADLRAACAAAAGLPRVVAWDAGVATTRGEVLGRADLRLYDVQGRLVRELVSEVRPGGLHEARWDGYDNSGRAVASGTYFARLRFGDQSRVKSLVLVR